ncbi:MAG: hypothetical protein AAF585_06810 [Verrucomicrobiota bacterium]
MKKSSQIRMPRVLLGAGSGVAIFFATMWAPFWLDSKRPTFPLAEVLWVSDSSAPYEPLHPPGSPQSQEIARILTEEVIIDLQDFRPTGPVIFVSGQTDKANPRSPLVIMPVSYY